MASTVPPQSADPRTHVTPEAFRVDPALLGRPLAGPWRRGLALAVDGAAVGLLANAPSAVFGLAAAYVLLRASVRPAAGGLVRRSMRWTTRAFAAVFAFLVAVWLWDTVRERFEGEEASGPASTEVTIGEGGARIGGLAGLLAAAQVVAVVQSENEAEARVALDDLVTEMEEAGMTEAELLGVLSEIETSETPRPWIQAAIDSTVVRLEAEAEGRAAADSARALTGDQALDRYVAAVAAGDSARVAELRDELPVLLAADRLTGLEEDLGRAENRVDSLQEALEEAERPGGVLEFIRTVIDDLGLGFGWGGLYFTAFTVLWRGATPGKRLFGIRVVVLDGTPIGWWRAFERFAGYAAGLATGLLGFLQIFWDDNRQGIHDQIARTVVVRDES